MSSEVAVEKVLTAVAPEEKPKVVIIAIDTNDSKQTTNGWLESLSKECAHYRVEKCSSFDVAFSCIEQLDSNTRVILIVAGHAQKKLNDQIPRICTLHPKIRNLFVYSNENENIEKPTTPFTQHVFGKRHLFSAIHDVLDALDVSPTQGHQSQYVTIIIHQSTLNELFNAVKSIQVNAFGFSLKISKMKIVLSPLLFQFTADVKIDVKLGWSLPITEQNVHGECDLILDENTKKIEIKIKKFIVQLGGPKDVAWAIPPFPLNGFIDCTRPFSLFDSCEVKQLMIIPRDLKYTIEEQRLIISVQVYYAER